MFFLTSFTVLSFSAVAWAGLGDDLSQAPRDLENSTESSSKLVGTNVIEKTVATSYSVLREYADNAGFVFAVTWTGVRPPDLRNILGSSRWNEYKTLRESFNRPGRGHSPRKDTGTDFVVFHGGHMGAVTGRAWLPGHVPPGVDPENLP